jgi:hypothetical protein
MGKKSVEDVASSRELVGGLVRTSLDGGSCAGRSNSFVDPSDIDTSTDSASEFDGAVGTTIVRDFFDFLVGPGFNGANASSIAQ